MNNYKIINAGGNGKEFEINSSNLNIKSLDHLKDTIDVEDSPYTQGELNEIFENANSRYAAATNTTNTIRIITGR